MLKNISFYLIYTRFLLNIDFYEISIILLSFFFSLRLNIVTIIILKLETYKIYSQERFDTYII